MTPPSTVFDGTPEPWRVAFQMAWESWTAGSLGIGCVMVNDAGTVVVGKMIDKIEPDMTQLAKERDNILQQLKQKQAMQRQTLFRDSVVTRLMKEGTLKIHRDAISQLVARYRAG